MEEYVEMVALHKGLLLVLPLVLFAYLYYYPDILLLSARLREHSKYRYDFGLLDPPCSKRPRLLEHYLQIHRRTESSHDKRLLHPLLLCDGLDEHI